MMTTCPLQLTPASAAVGLRDAPVLHLAARGGAANEVLEDVAGGNPRVRNYRSPSAS